MLIFYLNFIEEEGIFMYKNISKSATFNFDHRLFNNDVVVSNISGYFNTVGGIS